MSTLQVGDVLLVAFPYQDPQAIEIEGQRPALVVGIPEKIGPTRFPCLLVAPITTSRGAFVQAAPQLYPILLAGTGKLRQESVVLLDQIRAIDQKRILGRIGSLTKAQYQPIQATLKKIF